MSGDVLEDWIAGGPEPERGVRKAAVKAALAELARRAPGRSVEVRVPPFGAVQCIEGPRHTRGTPPNVVETDARTWLLMATGRLTFAEALSDARIDASGSRAEEVAKWLPIFGPLVGESADPLR